MKKIIVASANPTKVTSTHNGFKAMFETETFEVQGVTVPSGVSDQPIGNEETYLGAYQRTVNARAMYPSAHYWVGIEGGNILHPNQEMEVMAWIVIVSANQLGKARTAGFFIPPSVVALIHQGYELAHADDLLFKMSNSKHSSGASGILTHGVMDRIEFYTPAVILALIPFKNPDLYDTYPTPPN